MSKCRNVTSLSNKREVPTFHLKWEIQVCFTARRLCVHLNAFHVQSYFFCPAAPTVIRGPPNEYAQPAILLDLSTQWNVDLDVTHLTEKHWCIFLLRNSISTHKRACSEIRCNSFLHRDKGKAIIADVCQVLNKVQNAYIRGYKLCNVSPQTQALNPKLLPSSHFQ